MKLNIHIFRGAALAAFATIAGAASAQSEITVTIDGRPVHFEGTGPQMVDGRVLVPLRGVFERLGAYVQWNEAQHEVVATRGHNNVELQIGNPNATVDNRQVTLDVPAQIVDGSTMVPIRFVSESIGAQVRWRDAEQMVVITSGGGRAQTITEPAPMPHEQTRDLLERGTIIPVTLGDNLSSSRSLRGEQFGATVQVEGTALEGILPRGTRISGEITDVARPRGGGDPGTLNLDFTRLILPDGTRIPIVGQAYFDRNHPRTAHMIPGTQFSVRLMRDVRIRG